MAPLANLETFARMGYLARGILYLSLGYVALRTADGEGTTSILERLHGGPAGSFVLLIVAFGLFGYGLFRVTAGIIDLDDEGNSTVGVVTRIGLVVSGLAHWLLCYVAMHIFWIGNGGAPGREEQAARTAFEYPGGAVLVGLIGALVMVTGVGQLVSAWRGQFMNLLDVRTPRITRFAGAAGYAARGLVFVVVGWQIIALAIGWGGRQLGMDSALHVIAKREWIFPCVAAGLVLFGIFSLIVAWYIRVRDEDVKRRARLRWAWWFR